MQGEIEQSPRNSQIQQSFIIKNYKNIGLLILLCLFILFVVIVFYFFISLMSTDNETSSFFQYKIVEYDVSDSSIYIQADCIDCQSYYEIKSNYIATSLNITISFLSQTHLNIQIKGLTFPYQYEVPHKLPFPDYKNPFSNSSTSFKEYQVTAVYNPMRLIIIRNQTNEVIFDTADFELIYSRFYIEITTKLPTKFIYGLGERNGLFALENDTYTIWNRMPRYNATNDTASFNYSSNTFGSQPIYMVKENHSYFHTVFLRNFNAMDIDFNNSESDPSLQFRIVILTLFFISFIENRQEEHLI